MKHERKAMPLIHGRMVDALITRHTQHDLPAKYLFLGDEEWEQLEELCEFLGVPFPKGGAEHDPVNHEEHRAKFREIPIYRVNAKAFLAAL